MLFISACCTLELSDWIVKQPFKQVHCKMPIMSPGYIFFSKGFSGWLIFRRVYYIRRNFAFRNLVLYLKRYILHLKKFKCTKDYHLVKLFKHDDMKPKQVVQLINKQYMSEHTLTDQNTKWPLQYRAYNQKKVYLITKYIIFREGRGGGDFRNFMVCGDHILNKTFLESYKLLISGVELSYQC